MNWMKALLETYDACISDPALMEDPVPLLPICHTTNQAQIEITLNPDGELCDVKIVPKEHQTTVNLVLKVRAAEPLASAHILWQTNYNI